MADGVTNHKAYGVGAYSFWRDQSVWVENGFKVPSSPGIVFENALTVYLNGNGGIRHVINGKGDTLSDKG